MRHSYWHGHLKCSSSDRHECPIVTTSKDYGGSGGIGSVVVSEKTHNLIREDRRACTVCGETLVCQMWQPRKPVDRLMMVYRHEAFPLPTKPLAFMAGSKGDNICRTLHRINGTGN